MDRRLVVLCLFVGLLFIPLGSAATYDISTNQMLDVPDRERSGFEVTHVTRVEQGETLVVDTEGPEAGYDVLLKNPRGTTVRAKRDVEGDATVEFELSGAPGSWAVTITDPGLVAVHPVVVKGYTVETNPETTTVTQGDKVQVNLTVTEISGVNEQKDINRVEAVLATDSEEVRVTADQVDGKENKYEATLSTEELSSGEYKLFGVVRGNQEIPRTDRDELLGISDITEVTIETDTTDSDNSNNGGNTGGGNAGGAGGAPSTNPTAIKTPESTATSTPTGGPTGTTPGASLATVTTQRLTNASVAADVRINQSDADTETDESAVAIIRTDATSDSGSLTANTVRIESQNVAQYTANISVRDTAQKTAPGEQAVGTVTVDHSLADDNVVQAAFNLSVKQSRLKDSNLSANAVAVYREHDGEWTRLDTDVVSTAGPSVTLHAETPGLSSFVIAERTAQAPAVVDVGINNPNISTGTPATVTATVQNQNTSSNDYAVEFMIGDRRTTRTVTIAAGNTTTVTHTVRELSGTQRAAVYVNGVYAGLLTGSGETATNDENDPAGERSTTRSATATTTPSSVITPTETTTPTSTNTGTPGFTALLFIIALAGFLITVSRN
ncbi:PGF-pre-PGF domain-containing protein [Halobellus sp. EA9]|uniref:PGF-pre-PGF domain-containing protein n=1 Tax=Halobellus sp. EA9 TaxID=3421647 RepID=UPI003EBBF0B8